MKCKFPIFYFLIELRNHDINNKNSQITFHLSIHRVIIVNHWKKQHLNYHKKKHLLNPTTTDRRLRVPKLFPKLFQQLEAALYTSAPTKELYMNKDTLQERLVAVSVRNKCFGRLEARSWSYFLQMGKNASCGGYE